MRQIVLDTETTGLETRDGHRIIEVGCVEVINRRLTGNRFHYYINPERDIDEGAQEVHGISRESLEDKPLFSAIADDLLDYLKGAELVIHNAPFDVGFLDSEYKRYDSNWAGLESHCTILDSLTLARKMHPGQKNNLDALCKRYYVDNTQRELHGALLDAEILAEVYLAMTGGQRSLVLSDDPASDESGGDVEIQKLSADRPRLAVIKPTDEEMLLHQQRVEKITADSGEPSLWDV